VEELSFIDCGPVIKMRRRSSIQARNPIVDPVDAG
jgi:hypothetical protein